MNLRSIVFLLIFFGVTKVTQAQCSGGRCTASSFNNQTFKSLASRNDAKKEPKTYYYEESYDIAELYEEQEKYNRQEGNSRRGRGDYDDEFTPKKDIAWKRKGFEFFIGGGIYFGGKKTANYYNGAPENDINLNLLMNNEQCWLDLRDRIKKAYPAIDDNFEIVDKYNRNSSYQMAMDVAVGAKYRIQQNWYIELGYSFRRLTCDNRFSFNFPGGIPGNKENPPYSAWQFIVAKEDRHYIDFSVGYILQIHEIAKPFFSFGAFFNYIRIKSFHAIIEGDEQRPYDLMFFARHPDWNGIEPVPNYHDWAGPGFGTTFTVGLKIAINRAVSLDPVFQLSIGSFGNNKANLPGFDTSPCVNYMAGVRIVLNDALFFKKN